MSTMIQIPDTLSAGMLSVAVFSPDYHRRDAAMTALAEQRSCQVREFNSYPPSLDSVHYLLKENFDAVLIDLDSDPEYALDMVESISVEGSATVMVYSARIDPEIMMRSMRAGAREFLTLPFNHKTVSEALVRASARHPEALLQKRADGRLFVFIGAKGGSGVTTVACNFAVSLAKESGQRTLLIDLNLPLGDAAINLGLATQFTTVDALQNASRLDPSFLSTLLVRHNSGLYVLAAPDELTEAEVTHDAVDKLLAVTRQSFDYVVVDAGRKDLWRTNQFDESATFYLVTQVGVPELRNANRLITQFSTLSGPNLEIVLNRYQVGAVELAEQHITRALTRPARWKVPNSYATVLRMQKTAIPLALEDSSISRIIHEMARSIFSQPVAPEKKKKFSLFQRGPSLVAGGSNGAVQAGGF